MSTFGVVIESLYSSALCNVGIEDPNYFLEIEFSNQLRKLPLSPRKYAQDLLQLLGLLGYKLEISPIEAWPKFWDYNL